MRHGFIVGQGQFKLGIVLGVSYVNSAPVGGPDMMCIILGWGTFYKPMRLIVLPKWTLSIKARLIFLSVSLYYTHTTTLVCVRVGR